MSDYPNYTNVSEIVYSNLILPNETDRFAMSSAKESAIMTITEIIEANSFDEKM